MADEATVKTTENAPPNPIGQHFVCLPCLDCDGEVEGVRRGEGAVQSDVDGWCCWCGDWAEASDTWCYKLPSAPRGDRCDYVHMTPTHRLPHRLTTPNHIYVKSVLPRKDGSKLRRR